MDRWLGAVFDAILVPFLDRIYDNPSDPSLLVDRRFGVGYDLNWGNPLS
jgi:hypothetical protein